MWCFAIVNRRLAEIYYDKGRKETTFYGHAYVDRKSYKTKKAQKWIEHDTKKIRFTFKNGKYKSLLGDKVFFLQKDTIDEDYKKGKILSFDSVDEMLESLED